MSEEEIRSVIRRARAGEADAFDALIDRFGTRLYGFFYRCVGSRDAAEDLLQEVFLRVVRTIDRYEHTDRFEAWLFRIAANLVRDRIRQLRRRPIEVSIDADNAESFEECERVLQLVDASCAKPGERAEKEEEMDRVQRALRQIPDAEREVVMLRHFSQLSFAEIADAMRTPLGTALARGHRGLTKLRAILEPGV